MNIEIKKSLSVLELGDLARIIEMQEKDIKLVDLSYEKRLELLLETLIQERENRLINRLIKNAYFKYPSASIESLDYDARQIKKSTILNLATMGFVANATNLVITGPTVRERLTLHVPLAWKHADRLTGFCISGCLT